MVMRAPPTRLAHYDAIVVYIYSTSSYNYPKKNGKQSVRVRIHRAMGS